MIILQTHFTNVQKIIPSKNEIWHYLFVDTHPAQKINRRRKDIHVVSQRILTE